ncbi:MAG TPA: response regulator [Myxococcota bacterium]|nr:response regulator [Myxococcota bacterium]HRY96353.1 response regulator [Myxococcota bacterium]HSA20794.1 response regulator [Myxococcota bacterium]
MKFGEKLIQARLIDAAQLDAALRHQNETGQRIGEALLELGYISEEVLLKYLAAEFSTRFVSTAKLARLSPPASLLEKVPARFAEEHLLFPVQHDPARGMLGVVSCEPQDQRALDELRTLTQSQKLQVFVALREAIQAAIRKHYKGDLQAFTKLEQPARPAAAPGPISLDDTQVGEDTLTVETEAKPKASGPAVQRSAKAPAEGASWTRQIEAVRDSSLVSDNDFIETLNILVGLVEVQRASLQGHSARVARTVKGLSERLGLTERERNHNIIAAYLHDLGKRSSLHLTVLSIAAKPEHRERAQRYHLTPARLFDSVHLPPQVNQILTHVYECYDGTGLPEQLQADGIPLGSQLIAVADAFEDLTQNPSNHLGRQLQPEQALAELRAASGRQLSPRVVSAIEELVRAEASTAQLTAGSPLVLLADRDAASTSVLELKLVKNGFRVRVARDSHAAEDILQAESPAACIVDLQLEPEDGFHVLSLAQKLHPDSPAFLTASNPQPEVVTRAFKSGAVDFLTKPYLPDVLLAKLQKELAGKPAPAATTAQDMLEPIILGPPPAAGAGEPELEVEVDVSPSEGEEISTGVTIELEDAGGTRDPLDGELGEATPGPARKTPPPVGGPDLTAPFGEVSSAGIPGPPQGTMAGVVTTSVRILSGTLEGKRALALIKALSGKRKTGVLSLRQGEKKGTIFFEKGHIFQAILGEVQAEEAFLELAAWQDCLYKFDPSQTIPTRTIKTQTGKLIQIATLSE